MDICAMYIEHTFNTYMSLIYDKKSFEEFFLIYKKITFLITFFNYLNMIFFFSVNQYQVLDFDVDHTNVFVEKDFIFLIQTQGNVILMAVHWRKNMKN